MSKHTPGPWVSYLQADSTAHIVATEKRDSHGRREQDVVRVVSGEANARLIAAAPDLLALIKRLAVRDFTLDAHNPGDNLSDTARALVKAIEGES